jgi:hypothetical protein
MFGLHDRLLAVAVIRLQGHHDIRLTGILCE